MNPQEQAEQTAKKKGKNEPNKITKAFLAHIMKQAEKSVNELVRASYNQGYEDALESQGAGEKEVAVTTRREAIEECVKIIDNFYAPDVHNVASKLRALSQATDKGGK